jgi:hypothetical protein
VYACEVDSKKEIIPDDIMVNFWTDFPAWVNVLFKLRNFLVKFVGLKGTEGGDLKEFEKCIRIGGTYGFASVPMKSDNETILLLTDKHLNAYISVHVESMEEHKTISAITLVNFNNKLGRVYFFIIRPFHGIVVKSMLKRAVNKVVHST